MIHKIDIEFRKICIEIIEENKTKEEWASIESDDMFSSDSYLGGFDSTEMEFCFSVFINHKEYWFQQSLEEVNEIAIGNKTEVEIRMADY